MNPTYLFYGKELNKREARHLAADLLAFAGPERPAEFHFTDGVGCRLHVHAGHRNKERVVFRAVGGGVFLDPAQIDALIDWLKGHREDNPA